MSKLASDRWYALQNHHLSSLTYCPLLFVLRVNMKTPERLAYRGLPFAEFIVCCRRRRLMHYGTFMEAIEKEREALSPPIAEKNGRKMGIRCFETQLPNQQSKKRIQHHLCPRLPFSLCIGYSGMKLTENDIGLIGS